MYECWDSQLSMLLLLPNKHQPHSQAFLGRLHVKEAKYTADEPSKDVVTASPYTIREQRTLSLDTITPTAWSSVFICQCLSPIWSEVNCRVNSRQGSVPPAPLCRRNMFRILHLSLESGPIEGIICMFYICPWKAVSAMKGRLESVLWG